MNGTKPFTVCVIVAMDQARVIGFKNRLPWHIPEDMKRFAKLTTGHTVLMGRKTYESLPDKFRPLPKRKNMVITRSPAQFRAAEVVLVFSSPGAAIEHLHHHSEDVSGGQLWIIGGGEIYRENMEYVDQIYLTVVDGTHEGDVYFPEFEQDFVLAEWETHEGFEYRLYRRKTQASAPD
nr:Dihydrofolate reductase [uncultured bacterium]